MTSITAKSSGPAKAPIEEVDNQQNEEQRTTGHMHGWALASLTLAFMSICFVLALDNTILDSSTRPGVITQSYFHSSDRDSANHQRLPKSE